MFIDHDIKLNKLRMMKDDETEERQDVHDVYSDDSLSDWSTVFLVFSIKYLQLTMENKKEGESRVESSRVRQLVHQTTHHRTVLMKLESF